jgi:ssDNA thymidine ADP-ribosyltransferase, DarT
MTTMPAHPKIYHITHLDNLRAIATQGELISDAQRIASAINCLLVGMSNIKRRRLETITVSVCPGTKVGEYVPFYFCPRSIMLYILHKGNHPDITYRGGQNPIVHLEADLKAAIQWAEINFIPWAFSDGNAGAYVTQFYNQRADLNQIDWSAIAATDFSNAQIKERKQAEFLTFGTFPWTLIQKIGTIDNTTAAQVAEAIAGIPHQPTIEVRRNWYF